MYDVLAPFLWSIGIIVGFLLLNEGAKLITDNAVVVARKSGYSRFVVGVLVVSVLTALPEVLVSLFALEKDSPSLALANAFGSHTVNVSFVIGISAMIIPIAVKREMVTRDAIFLLIITLVATALILDGDLTFWEGGILILLFIPYAINLLSAKTTIPPKEIRESLKDVRIELTLIGKLSGKKVKIKAGKLWLVLGIVIAVGSAYLVTESALNVSELFGVNEWFIGISIVAIGTTLPDIMAGYHAARRGHGDLALAIGIGASIFTILLILGLMGIFYPAVFGSAGVSLMMPMIIGMNVIMLSLLFFMIRGWTVTKSEGVVLFLMYIAILLSYLFVK